MRQTRLCEIAKSATVAIAFLVVGAVSQADVVQAALGPGAAAYLAAIAYVCVTVANSLLIPRQPDDRNSKQPERGDKARDIGRSLCVSLVPAISLLLGG